MALIDVPADDSAAAAAKRIKRLFRLAVLTSETSLNKIVADITTHGKATIAAELGSDAATFAAAYDAIRDVVNTYKPGASIPARNALP